ncbi:MAG TPA: glycogen debranching enzyme, partial [Mycolicibacterium fallax]|nr:glycogen debranching enzyme [Mycolicibacterium fallax]
PGLDQRGHPVNDDSFLLCFNAHHEQIEFRLPPANFGAQWLPVIDTTAERGAPEDPPEPLPAASTVTVGPRAMVVLQAPAAP